MILSHGKKRDAVDADHVLFEATPRLATIDERLPQRPRPEAVASADGATLPLFDQDARTDEDQTSAAWKDERSP
jgi:hypothetical protein